MIPYIGEVDPVDSRLKSIAEFLGIRCETLPLDQETSNYVEFIENAVADRRLCFLLNPRVLQRWIAAGSVPAELVSCLVYRFPYLLVHGLRVSSFDASVIAALSERQLLGVQTIGEAGQVYEFEKDTNDVCHAFSGIKFGPTNPVNDHVIGVADSNVAVRRLISIGSHVFMASMKRGQAEILFLASEDVADLDSVTGDSPMGSHFSRLVPLVMALRHLFGQECWLPGEANACVVIDDPLLRGKYGYLDFGRLSELVEKYNFHTCIAFIPHNYRRNSPRIAKLFRNNAERLSICFHGNDHTKEELASTDTGLLNTILRIAMMRMDQHGEKTGLVCDKVMVFPQGAFSVEAMKVLKTLNFLAAVNTGPNPLGQSLPLTIREYIQPAVLRYAGFPLFLRRYVKEIRAEDIAFSLFFGKPVLIVEHHEIFKHPELLVDVVEKVNSLAPGIHWCGLERAVSKSFLTRKGPDGARQIRAYSGEVRIANDSNRIERLSIEWNGSGVSDSVEQVLNSGIPCPDIEIDECGVRIQAELPPRSSRTFSVIHRNIGPTRLSIGFKKNAKAFVRRRLSELRDNHLSRNPRLLHLTRALHERYFE